MGKNNKKQNKQEKSDLKEIWRPDPKTPSDVTGSYIGTPSDGEQPEQDADDL